MKTEMDNYVDQAIKFIDRYKSYFNWDDDLIQEALYKFTKYYEEGRGRSVNSFIKLCLESSKRDEIRIKNLKKNNGMIIPLYSINDGKCNLPLNEYNELSDYDLTDEEVKQQEKLKHAMNSLKDKDNYIIDQLFVQGRTIKDLSIEFGVSHQAMYAKKKTILNKLKKKITK